MNDDEDMDIEKEKAKKLLKEIKCIISDREQKYNDKKSMENYYKALVKFLGANKYNDIFLSVYIKLVKEEKRNIDNLKKIYEKYNKEL
jgi:hypothetical protein|nr:MAG TPA: hypothetical protein [Caudoviricetes sp.]